MTDDVKAALGTIDAYPEDQPPVSSSDRHWFNKSARIVAAALAAERQAHAETLRGFAYCFRLAGELEPLTAIEIVRSIRAQHAADLAGREEAAFRAGHGYASDKYNDQYFTEDEALAAWRASLKGTA